MARKRGCTWGKRKKGRCPSRAQAARAALKGMPKFRSRKVSARAATYVDEAPTVRARRRGR